MANLNWDLVFFKLINEISYLGVIKCIKWGIVYRKMHLKSSTGIVGEVKLTKGSFRLQQIS